MARRNSYAKREIAPDIRYNSVLVAKFINKLMKGGKKALAEKILYQALDNIQNKHKLLPLEVFETAIRNVRPYLIVVSVRVGGANYQVPSPVDERRSESLASDWLISFASKRSEKSMIDKLAGEFFDAYNNRGGSHKKKEETHKMAEANRAFAHFSEKRSAAKKSFNRTPNQNAVPSFNSVRIPSR